MALATLDRGVKSTLRFDELRIPVGERVRLETLAPKRRLDVTYVGSLAEQGILVSLPIVRKRPLLLVEGSNVNLRLVALNRACAFTTRVIKSLHAPLPLLMLAYPRRVEAVTIRTTTRAATRLIVSLDEVEEGHGIGRWPRQAICSDISFFGARIESSDMLADCGEQLLMTARMPVGDLDQVLLVRCRVCNLEEVEDPARGEYRIVHGVEFIDLDEESRLILNGYVYQQLLREQTGLG